MDTKQLDTRLFERISAIESAGDAFLQSSIAEVRELNKLISEERGKTGVDPALIKAQVDALSASIEEIGGRFDRLAVVIGDMRNDLAFAVRDTMSGLERSMHTTSERVSNYVYDQEHFWAEVRDRLNSQFTRLNERVDDMARSFAELSRRLTDHIGLIEGGADDN